MFAERTQRIEASGIRKVFNLAKEMENEGPIIHFEIGRPHLPLPQNLAQELCNAINNGQTSYGHNLGNLSSRKVLAKWISEKFLVREPLAESELMFTVGASEAVAAVIATFVGQDDEVIIVNPAWSHYCNLVNFFNGNVVELNTSCENNYLPTVEGIEKKITKKTKLLVINNPGNPTGSVYPSTLLEAIDKLAQERNFILLSDEIYSTYDYEDNFTSVAKFNSHLKNLIIISGFSKILSATGLRVGYIQTNSDFLCEINKVHQYLTVCAPTPCVAAIEYSLLQPETEKFVKASCESYKRNQKIILDIISQSEVLKVGKLQGAFYAFIEYPDKYGKSEMVAMDILRSKRVALVPGKVFGDHYDNHLRLSYATSEEELKIGLNEIISYFQEIDRGLK